MIKIFNKSDFEKNFIKEFIKERISEGKKI